MRASTLFAATIAILLGLGAVVTAKQFGLFQKPAGAEEKKVERPKVLVARQNLYENMAITANQARLRDLRDDELEHWKANRDKYLPATVEAAVLRVPKQNIEADQPILKDQLQDLTLPDVPTFRLAKGMRAVNVALPRDRAVGGLIVAGDRVDVLLTTKISYGGGPESSRSAFIARNLRVLLKRNSLWTVLAPTPEDRPLDFTLEANPYRAALIEFARDKGTISLLPSPAPKDMKISTSGPDEVAPAVEGSEFRDDERRVDEFLRGDAVVGEADLERIFKVKPPPPPRPPIVIAHFNGISDAGTTVFAADGTLLRRPDTQSRPDPQSRRTDKGAARDSGDGQVAGFRFSAPPASSPAGGSPAGGKPARGGKINVAPKR
jgi:Flp pilus assembly protein CpaB